MESGCKSYDILEFSISAGSRANTVFNVLKTELGEWPRVELKQCVFRVRNKKIGIALDPCGCPVQYLLIWDKLTVKPNVFELGIIILQ